MVIYACVDGEIEFFIILNDDDFVFYFVRSCLEFAGLSCKDLLYVEDESTLVYAFIHKVNGEGLALGRLVIVEVSFRAFLFFVIFLIFMRLLKFIP